MSITNEELVLRLMNHSQHGVLAQAFVIEALAAYAQRVLDLGEPEDDGTGLISKKAWFAIAGDVLHTIENRNDLEGNRIQLIDGRH
jgi:hypothetical protein